MKLQIYLQQRDAHPGGLTPVLVAQLLWGDDKCDVSSHLTVGVELLHDHLDSPFHHLWMHLMSSVAVEGEQSLRKG